MARTRIPRRRRSALWIHQGVLLGLLPMGLVIAVLCSLPGAEQFRPVKYSSGALGIGGSQAQFMPAGSTPTTSAVGHDITVSWAQSVLASGTAVNGYVVSRFDMTGVQQTTLSGCNAVVAGLSCTENSVPTGAWQYTVTPRFTLWTGTPGPKSAPQVSSAATLTFPNSIVTTLPTTLPGTVTGFGLGEAITFHLDGVTGPLLAGTAMAVPINGTALVTVIIPAGIDDSAHSVFAVGNQGTVASHSITILDPPVLISMQMLDTNGNGKIDKVTATFSKPLASYTAGTLPWTLSAVPSGGILTSVVVVGTTATLNIAEGAGAPDTSVGSFTIALAFNSRGIRDLAGQPASFTATAPKDKAAPVAISLQLFDNNVNGKVDTVVAVFSEQLDTYAAGTNGWVLLAVPSSGSLASVSVSGTTATLALTEGVGPPDTAAGSFTVALTATTNGIRDMAGNLATIAPTTPADKAPPVRLSMVMNDVNGNGKIDQVLMTFSEALAPYTAGVTGWTLISAPSGATLASVSVTGSTATLTLHEGTGAPTTAVGSFTVALAANVAGIRDGAGNQSSWAAAAPTN